MQSRLTALALTGFLILAANAAHAIPVEWTLNNWVTFTTGATVTGSFWFDDDTDTFSNILVSDSNGNNYGFVGPSADANQLQFVVDDPGNLNLDGTPYVYAELPVLGMTNAGGTLDLLVGTPAGSNPNSVTAFCSNADCQIGALDEYLVSGSITGVVIPEPSTAALLTLGLVVVAAQRRRC